MRELIEEVVWLEGVEVDRKFNDEIVSCVFKLEEVLREKRDIFVLLESKEV